MSSEPASPLPSMTSAPEEPGFGLTAYAERLNGRFAMVGFVALLVIEVLTGQGLLHWMGVF
ncbi:chlorophyll A-B binding protein [Rubidibacter lacunae KORDI 51-2]|uniref:Chlorophyll A-B binding protein n=1 Tax=Rubidibacter lacunae KORDI 51-2 TaxID=582515 RepID=U5DFK4_9CHRO|nr:chlorophyll a/b-binding protein [Rubidibacter lacunae]ERN40062.1 chlorophyll A-B binding protein [Rubidibacter lacunae KORDI 51-2]